MGIKKTSWKKLGAGLFIAGAIFSFFSMQTRAADQSDAIGVRVMPNPSHSSIYNWYLQQGFKGSPQSLIVDGYEAIRDGRTVFVNAANVDTTNRKLYTNVYLISYNQESAVKTVDILGQLISHWKFNSNIPTVGQCSISDKNCQADSDCSKDYICSNLAGSASQGKCILKENKQCLTDSDCPVNLFCDSLKAKVTRDVKRLGSLDQIKSALNSFKLNNGGYPNLQSGTYISGISLSLWPSWQENFWPQIKLSQLLVDPINILGYCAGYDATTCWNKDTNAFVSPELVLPYGSYAFLYKAASNGANYDLCAVFESKIAGIDTAEGQFTSNSCAIGAGYGGTNSNTAPTLVSSYTDGETGKEFNGYLKAKDLEGDTILWSLSPITPIASWTNWSGLPTLKDSGDVNQKKIVALKTGNPGTYKMLLKLSDSRGASATSEITFNIGAAGKPLIEAENVDYFVDPINPLKYTFYVQGSNATPDLSSLSFKPVNPAINGAINTEINKVNISLTKIGLNRVKVDFVITIPPSVKIPNDITIPYQIAATVNGVTATKDININLKIEQPYLDFQCENMARIGQPYQISDTGIARSCLLGSLKSGNHTIDYNVSGLSSLIIKKDGTSAYLEASPIYASTVDNEIKIKAINEYGATAEKTFKLKVNNFCGDGIKQRPNTEGRGGFYNDGNEECDGGSGVTTNSISISSDLQYGCTTSYGKSPYPIVDNNSCVFKPADNGGGYCGDGLCQFQINGAPMENCWNCQLDCGVCSATIISNADQEHIVYANGKRLYKEINKDATPSATINLIPEKNVFAFWTHNLNDLNYGLAFRIMIGPNSTNKNSSAVSFAEFNSSNVSLKCINAASSNGDSLSATDFEPAALESDGNYNWTEVGYNKTNWTSPVINIDRDLFNGGPYIWSRDSAISSGANYCRLSFDYKPYQISTCTRSCNGKNCGSDGCGNTCGFCKDGKTCDTTLGVCTCTPTCIGNCGPNGCGGSCGDCTEKNFDCYLGNCKKRNNCALKNCGEDSYGNTCGAGTCNGTCLAGFCVPAPNCGTKECGLDSNNNSCGPNAGACPTSKHCSSSGECLECLSSTDCPSSKPICSSSGKCVACLNNASCNDNNPCTDDVCSSGACERTNNNAAIDCSSTYGTCTVSGKQTCKDGSLGLCNAIDPRNNTCSGHDCGGDGCGGQCGTGSCPDYQGCIDNKCVTYTCNQQTHICGLKGECCPNFNCPLGENKGPNGECCSGTWNTTLNMCIINCESWTYSNWSTCTNNQQTRTVINSSPANCNWGDFKTSQGCVSPSTGCPGNSTCRNATIFTDSGNCNGSPMYNNNVCIDSNTPNGSCVTSNFSSSQFYVPASGCGYYP